MKKKSTSLSSQCTLTWYGHSAFSIASPSGRIVLIDPWLDNPKAPPGVKEFIPADIILITHGHSDHIGNTIEIAKRTNGKVFSIYELYLYLTGNNVPNATGMNKGGSVSVDDITITMVDAKHSSDIDANGVVLPGGEAAGFVVELEHGFTFYHAGDTSVFGDMQLIRRLYRPDVVLLPIGGLYTMGPREAAIACEFLKPKYIIGMHYGTFPPLTGTPAQLRKFLPASMKRRVLEVVPGSPIFL